MAEETRVPSLLRDYRATCTVPKHPRQCPECQSKVGVYHMNESEAAYMCSSENCLWPLLTHKREEICGQSDVSKFVRVMVEKSKSSLNASTTSSETSFEASKEGTHQPKSPQPSPHIEENTSFNESRESISNLSPEKPFLRGPPETPPRSKVPDSPRIQQFQVPQLLSPIAASPAPSRDRDTMSVASTPRHDDDDDFVKPTSTIGTPRRRATTPMYVPNIPPMLSPLPSTPYRTLDSERSVNIDDDLHLTDSEFSDVESTPRHFPQHPTGPDMPHLTESPRAVRASKHAYSKDLSQLALSPMPPPPPPDDLDNSSSSNSSSVKIMLKREKGNQWNVQNNEMDVVLPDKPIQNEPMKKLDKVVLNLKKSVGGNTWNIAEKRTSETPHANQEQSVLPKEERRGRKSKMAPMKIQNVEELANNSKPTPAPSTEKDIELPSSSTPDFLLPPPDLEPEPQEEPSEPANEKENISSLPLRTNFRGERPKVAQKTFLRSSKPARVKNIPNFPLSKKPVSPDTTVDNDLNFDSNWKEIADLSAKAASLLGSDGYNEVSHLLKAATGVKDIDLNFVKQVQSKLSINSGVPHSNLVTFYVGRSKTSIDLPTEESTMSVSETGAPVQVRLSSHSDGIIGDILKTKEPLPLLPLEPKKKGRPKSKNTNRVHSPPPTLVPQPSTSVPRCLTPSEASSRAHPLVHQGAVFDDILANPVAIDKFKHHLAVLMNGFEIPPEWANYNVDPFVAMMVSRSYDVAYQNINFEAMLNLYAKIVNYEAMVQNVHFAQTPEQANAGGSMSIDLQQPSSSIDLARPTSSNASHNDRTYAELQTVRGQVTNATQVLHQHHQQDSVSKEVNTVERNIREANEEEGEKGNSNSRLVLKQEAMTPMRAPSTNNPASVDVMSVRPAPASVSMVPEHMASQMQGKSGVIGRGELVVTFNYRSSHFGPIHALDEDEVRAIVALTEFKVEEREFRDKHGGRRSNGVYATAAATRARTTLPQDVVLYLDRAFTKRGMKDNIVGRKRRNYPQRSRIIKKDPVTGKLVYPNGEIVPHAMNVKPEKPDDSYKIQLPLPAALKTSSIKEKCDNLLVRREINEIIENTERSQAVSSSTYVEQPISLESNSTEGKQNKISLSLFGGKRKRQLERPQAQPLKNGMEDNSSGGDSSPKTTRSSAKKHYGKRKRQMSALEADAMEMVDDLLLQDSMEKIHGHVPSRPTKATTPPLKDPSPIAPKPTHSFNTRSFAAQTSDKRSHVNVNVPPVKRYFNPTALMTDPNTSSDVFIRQDRADKVKKFLEKKRKKEEKQRQRKLKRLMKAAPPDVDSGSQYRGMGQENPKASTNIGKRRFTTAQTIRGRKMILKEDGKIVEVAKKQQEICKKPQKPPNAVQSSTLSNEEQQPSTSINKSSTLTQEERDLMDNLFRISESLLEEPAVVDPVPQLTTSSSYSNQIVDATPSTSSQQMMPEFDFFQDGAFEKDFPSLDEMF